MKQKIVAGFLITVIVLSVLVAAGALAPWTSLPWVVDYHPPGDNQSHTNETGTASATETGTESATAPPVQLRIDDFPIAITPEHTVTITNNSENTVEVYDFRVTYSTASGTGSGTTCSAPSTLQPGQSRSCEPVHSNVVSISSVSVTVRADEQQIVVTYSVQTTTPEPSVIKKGDFLITIIPNRQVTLTNNSKSTIQVLEFSMTYDFYSYIMYNAPGGGTTYGPIVRGVLTSGESAVLQPGQSYPKTFNRQDMVAIISCRFSVKDVGTGQTLAVTYP